MKRSIMDILDFTGAMHRAAKDNSKMTPTEQNKYFVGMIVNACFLTCGMMFFIVCFLWYENGQSNEKYRTSITELNITIKELVTHIERRNVALESIMKEIVLLHTDIRMMDSKIDRVETHLGVGKKLNPSTTPPIRRLGDTVGDEDSNF